jgi:hypothetical protein
MSTTILQLASRVCRHLKVRDIHSMPADDATEVLDAINGAITEFFAAAPSPYRIKSNVTFNINAPQTCLVGVTHGSSSITGVDPSLVGRSISIPGDVQMNRMVDVNTLDLPYQGNTGSVTATCYCDAFALAPNFARFSGDPQIINQGIFVRYLSRQPDEGRFLGEAQVGFPLRFVVESQGQASGASPYFFLRLIPMPSLPLTLKVSMEVRPEQYTLNQLISPTPLPVSDEHVFSILLPMALSRLAGGLMWPQDYDPKIADAGLERAMALLSKMAPDAGPGMNFVKTPWRF